MKKIIVVFLIIFLLIPMLPTKTTAEEEQRGVFISYIELEEYIKKDSIEEAKKNINKILNNIKNFNLNTIILQVRPTADAIYDSKIFPYSLYVTKEEGKKTFDILDYFITESRKKNIKLIAWINPYRIRTKDDINSITEKSPAYKYLNTDTIYINKGIFFNPSKKEVEKLIIDGVKELLNYKIDGILFDDYFYPDKNIDIKDYEEYLKNNEYLTLEEYHLKIISRMVEKVHQECQKKNIPFGISPDGNIDNNYQIHFADIKEWLKSDKYLDFIMPQIYYGFYNSTKGYLNVLKEWEELLKEEKIKFYVALAFYKVGIEDNYAKEGRKEWIINDNILMREILLSRNVKNYSGFTLFRYDNVFNINNYTDNSLGEIENIKKIIK